MIFVKLTESVTIWSRNRPYQLHHPDTPSSLRCRFAVAMGYYGLSLKSGSLKGSIYMNTMLSGAVELVAYTACLSINHLGRKGPHVFGMMVAGLACFGNVIIETFTKGKYTSLELLLCRYRAILIVERIAKYREIIYYLRRLKSFFVILPPN